MSKQSQRGVVATGKEMSRPGKGLTDREMRRPVELESLVGFLADYNLSYGDVDVLMGRLYPGKWGEGEARRYYRDYPEVKEDVKAARAIVLREAGASKVKCVERYVEAQDAVKYTQTGIEYEDHSVRMAASDRLMKLMGEDVSGSGSKVSMQIGAGDHKIMIVTSGGRKVEDAV